MLLERLCSPFYHGGNITAADLCAAVWVCSQKFEKAQRTLFDRVSIHWFWLAFRFEIAARLKPEMIIAEAQIFSDYIKESQDHTPSTERIDTDRNKSGGISHCPFALIAKRDLMGEFGHSEAHVMDMTFAQVLWERESVAERNGLVEFREIQSESYWEEVDRINREETAKMTAAKVAEEANGLS